MVLTDADPMLPTLSRNVESNLSPEELSSTHVRRLVWGVDNDLRQFPEPFDLIFGADVVYERSCIHPMLQTFSSLTQCRPNALIILANERRDPIVYEEFLDAARKAGFEVSEIPLKRTESDGFVELVRLRAGLDMTGS